MTYEFNDPELSKTEMLEHEPDPVVWIWYLELENSETCCVIKAEIEADSALFEDVWSAAQEFRREHNFLHWRVINIRKA